MKIFISILLCVICGCASAREDRASETSNILAGYLMDWGKMRNHVQSCETDNDSHFLLGNCPPATKVDQFYLTAALATLGIKALVPSSVRHYFGGSNLRFSAHINADFDSTVSVAYSF